MSDWRSNLEKRIVIDTGAANLRIGLASFELEQAPYSFRNFIGKEKKTKKIYLENDILYHQHRGMELCHPLLRGLLYDSDLQTMLWQSSFESFYKDRRKAKLNLAEKNEKNTRSKNFQISIPMQDLENYENEKLKCEDKCMSLGISPFQPTEVLERYLEVVFEDLNFDAMFMGMNPTFSQYYFKNVDEETGELLMEDCEESGESICGMVVESGYSFTYVVPFFNNFPLNYAARRIDVGGKLLTNLLKNLISYRDFNLMHQTLLVDHIKRTGCYVSLDFVKEMENFHKKLHPFQNKEYVLPDYRNLKEGFIRDIQIDQNPKLRSDDQTIVMNQTMITIPEILFSPSDIEINQCGISEAIIQSIKRTPTDLQAFFYQNIILTGGNCKLRNFKERVQKELKKLAPSDAKINVRASQDCSETAWNGLKLFSSRENFEEYVVTREAYLESGSIVLNMFQY